MKEELLKECIESLCEIRVQVHDKVEPCVIADLDNVIVALRDQLKNPSGTAVTPQVATDVLCALARVINSASNLAEVIKDIFK